MGKSKKNIFTTGESTPLQIENKIIKRSWMKKHDTEYHMLNKMAAQMVNASYKLQIFMFGLDLNSYSID